MNFGAYVLACMEQRARITTLEADLADARKQIAELTTIRERRGMGFGDSQVECPTCLSVDSSSSVIKAVASLRADLKGEKNSAAYWKDLAETRDKGYERAEKECAELRVLVQECGEDSALQFARKREVQQKLTSLATLAAALVEALPVCDYITGSQSKGMYTCGKLATRRDYHHHACEEHRTAPNGEVYGEERYAAPLRALLAKLAELRAGETSAGCRFCDGPENEGRCGKKHGGECGCECHLSRAAAGKGER